MQTEIYPECFTDVCCFLNIIVFFSNAIIGLPF